MITIITENVTGLNWRQTAEQLSPLHLLLLSLSLPFLRPFLSHRYSCKSLFINFIWAGQSRGEQSRRGLGMCEGLSVNCQFWGKHREQLQHVIKVRVAKESITGQNNSNEHREWLPRYPWGLLELSLPMSTHLSSYLSNDPLSLNNTTLAIGTARWHDTNTLLWLGYSEDKVRLQLLLANHWVVIELYRVRTCVCSHEVCMGWNKDECMCMCTHL